MHCFKEIVAVASVTIIGSSFASPPLTSADEALIKEGQRIAETAHQLKQADWQQNAHMDTARQEAKRFFKELQTSSSVIQALQQSSPNKGNALPYKTLVFASYSLGERGLNDLLESVAEKPDTVVVFRGIPKEMNLGEGIRTIQALAAQKKPIPSIVIDPTLFKQFHVAAVPTLVVLKHLPSSGQAPQILASVQGMINLQWLRRRVAQGFTGDQGIKGPTEAISEPDLIDVLQERLVHIDWEKKKQTIAKQFWHKRHFYRLSLAKKTQTRFINPSITATDEVRRADGTVLIQRGTTINPLTLRDFTQAVIVFDPLDKRQLTWLTQTLPTLKKRPGVSHLTLIATQFDREKGWDAYTALTDAVEAPVYLLTPDIVERFALRATPSIITAQGKHFVVEEIVPASIDKQEAPL